MFTTLARMVAALAIALSLTMGAVTAASAAPAPQVNFISASAAPQAVPTQTVSLLRVTQPRGYVVNKTMAFLGCITGVGVPIGVGWAILSSTAAVAAVAKGGPLPPTVGAIVSKYFWYIKGTCGYALR